uniref:Uncharacterized protein n=1 Tax=Panagrolaimus superbus TaxID=310955 RepID=A0A914Z3I3_9BILA
MNISAVEQLAAIRAMKPELKECFPEFFHKMTDHDNSVSISNESRLTQNSSYFLTEQENYLNFAKNGSHFIPLADCSAIFPTTIQLFPSETQILAKEAFPDPEEEEEDGMETCTFIPRVSNNIEYVKFGKNKHKRKIDTIPPTRESVFYSNTLAIIAISIFLLVAMNTYYSFI